MQHAFTPQHLEQALSLLRQGQMQPTISKTPATASPAATPPDSSDAADVPAAKASTPPTALQDRQRLALENALPFLPPSWQRPLYIYLKWQEIVHFTPTAPPDQRCSYLSQALYDAMTVQEQQAYGPFLQLLARQSG
ncbi:MAG TPA: hypothetical protein H9687_03560 [Firmicutes bacterium]|nr:hypothetical protein [Bacillota bacterium]